MTLPNGFNTSYEYFKQTIEFLWQNSWIYQEANTCFLKSKILNQMPKEYMEYFRNIENAELNQFPYVHQPMHKLKVQTLIEFRQKLSTLIAEEAFKEPKEPKFISQSKFVKLKKMNVKKQHEIQRLAAEVNEILQTKHNEAAAAEQYVLIDFGSGLGYLSEMLYELLNTNPLVLGLESDLYRVEAAEQRVKIYLPNAANSIQYRQLFVTEYSKDFIEKCVEELLKSNYQQVPQQIPTKMAIIGLHACADLTITSMKLFFQMPHVQHLIIMPCCYHKLKMCDANLKFQNFPLSESLKQVLLEDDKINYASATTAYLNRPFLRLACQQTLKRWHKCSQEQHEHHGREMFFRAVAESIKHQPGQDSAEETQLVVVKRQRGKIDLCLLATKDVESFDTFSRLYGLKRKTTNEFVAWSEYHRLKFAELMKQYPKGWKLAEGLTCLQTSMQKLCENLVLYDRLCYMQETALNLNLNINVRYEKLMDEELSPRCYVLIAEKL